MTDLAPDAVIAEFRLESVAGQGGMGVVYRADDLALERPVALKFISPLLASDPEFRVRFERESRLAARIQHPNVVPVYRAGEQDGHLFLAMAWIEGASLRQVLDTEGRLDPARALSIVSQVAAALDAAHAAGLVHRDVKPGNILVARRSSGEHAYLTDFGLTKRTEGETTLTKGATLGTLDYAPPEQLKGEQVDGRTDVYSLGCVAFELFTGEVPFKRDTDMAKMYAHVHAPRPSVRALAPHLPSAVDAAVRRAMATEPGRRFDSAGEFAKALTGALDGQRQPEERRRPSRLQLALGGALAAVVVATVILLVGSHGSTSPPSPVPVRFTWRFESPGPWAKFLELTASGLRKGSRLTMSCAGNSCPPGFAIEVPRDTAKLPITSRVRGHRLRPGLRMTIDVTAPGFTARRYVWRVVRTAGYAQVTGGRVTLRPAGHG